MFDMLELLVHSTLCASAVEERLTAMAARARLRNRLVKNNAFLRQDQRLPIFGRPLELASPCARDSKTARSSGSPISRKLSPMSLGTGFSILGAGRRSGDRKSTRLNSSH